MNAKEAYTEMYKNPGYRMGEPRFREMVEWTNWVIEYVREDRRHIRLLDVGCGRGEILKHYAKDKDIECVGVEIVPDLCGSWDGYEVQLIECASRLPFTDEEFDIVLCGDVMEHVAPALTLPILKELARVGGTVVAHIALKPAVHSYKGENLHINLRSVEEWLKLLRSVGDVMADTNSPGQLRVAYTK